MKLTVTTLDDKIYNLDVSEDMELENFKALCEFEVGIPAPEISLLFNGRPLHDNKMKLKDYGMNEGDVVLLQRIQGGRGTNIPQNTPQGPAAAGGLPISMDFSQIQIPGAPGPSQPRQQASSGLPDDPATLMQMLKNSPHDLALLKERNPPLADALLSGSIEKFTQVLRSQQDERASKDRERIQLINSDPFDPNTQQKIAEEIRLKNVETNMEAAMEYAPESFGQVVMLYIDCKVNGHPVKAFVDSGAQMTIMSQACAKRCAIERLIDRRWAGIAKGVGTQKIIGRVHLCQIQIEKDFLQTSFSILEDQPMDMLLGLDMLKRHQCILDLKTNKLLIGTTGTETTFLAEGELPDHARLNRSISSSSNQMDEDKQLAEALTRSAQEAVTSQSSGASTSGASASSTTNASRFPEATIAKITANGFNREQAIYELTQSNGDVDKALVALLAKSFQFPS